MLKFFEFGNHVGNLFALIVMQAGIVQFLSAVVGSDYYTDYYPFGMQMAGRNYLAANSRKYGYSFNGQEKESDLNENITTAEFWEYDSRIGRRWNVDPIKKEFESPYLCFGGNPIWFVDPNGKDTLIMHRSEIKSELSNERTAIYIVTFSIIENGIERRVETASGKELYMISNREADKRADNVLTKDYYKLRFDKMSAHKDRDNDIRITQDGVFLHPGKDAGWVDGCKILTIALEEPTPGLLLPKTTYEQSEVALQEVKDLFNSVKKELTGDKFLLKTKSDGPEKSMKIKFDNKNEIIKPPSED